MRRRGRGDLDRRHVVCHACYGRLGMGTGVYGVGRRALDGGRHSHR